MQAARRFDVLEREGLPGVLLVHRPAEEVLAVEDSDLGHVARVVADRDGLTDIGRQSRGHIAQALKMDAVAAHAARLGNHDEQQVESLEAFG